MGEDYLKGEIILEQLKQVVRMNKQHATSMSSRLVILMAAETECEVLEYLESRQTAHGDFAIKANGGLKTLWGCPVRVDDVWIYGWYVQMECV